MFRKTAVGLTQEVEIYLGLSQKDMCGCPLEQIVPDSFTARVEIDQER
jgi:hypothetical protein